MASERDLELLDDYISNRLSAEDKAAFEQQLDANPGLRSEYQLQKRIAESLRQARALELKAMLKSVPASALHGGEASAALKATLWIAAAAIVGTGLYFYLKPEAPAVAPVPQEEISHDTTTPSASSEAPKDEQAPVVTDQEQPKTAKQKPATDTQQPSTASENAGTQETAAERAPIQAFDPSAEATDSAAPKSEAAESTTKVVRGNIPVQTDNSNRKYNFHYQIKDGMVYLYGPFKKDLYEIMEFFSDNNKRTIFLFHQNNYYLLNEDNTKVKPLAAINDPLLLKKLKEYRGK